METAVSGSRVKGEKLFARKKSPAALARVYSRQVSPTEQRNRRSHQLDQLPTAAAVELLLREEAKVSRVLLQHRRHLVRAVQLVAQGFRAGGRLFYFGAGTSGRLGVLDASECPPTFRVPPEMVQGVIAGGDVALRRAVEGAEDDFAAGGREVRRRRVGARDVVIGIAASGTTPFIWGALTAAKQRQARTLLLCFNPYLVIPKELRPTLVLAPNLGPEVLTGSTRLKAGTATKVVLNLLTTLAMVKLGKVVSNLMVDVHPSNTKLRTRAVRIVGELTGASVVEATEALEKSNWVIRAACRRLRA